MRTSRSLRLLYGGLALGALLACERTLLEEAPPQTRPGGVMRADLSICGSLGPVQASQPATVDPAQFAHRLHGTWARDLEWKGVKVETESALYFDASGGQLAGMMYDQSNVGTGPITRQLESLRASGQLSSLPVMTFVDCDYDIVDRYYKISSDFVWGLDFQPADPTSLRSTWDELVASGFFNRTFTPASTGTVASVVADDTSTGGGSPNVLDPSVGGAYWQGSLAGDGQGGALLRLNGDYRGSHVGDGTAGSGSVQFLGTEVGRFFGDGASYVAATSGPQPEGMDARSGLAALEMGGWSTDCADFFDLSSAIVWERVVLAPGSGGGAGVN